MKCFIFVILILVDINLFAQNEWEFTYEMEGIPLGLEIVDLNNLYVVTTRLGPTYLYKSIDRGKNWYLINDDFGKAQYCYSISVPDLENIFITFDDGNFYQSVDGGKSFLNIMLDSVNSFKKVKMYNDNIGVLMDTYISPLTYYTIIITNDNWKSFEKFNIDVTKGRYSYRNPVFISDSILYSVVYNTLNYKWYLLLLNINTKEYQLNYIDTVYEVISDLCIINEKLIFVCGKSNTISGGSGHDAIYKSTDGGSSWRRVLDLSTTASKHFYNNPFGLQSIAFKDSLTGIAVGQFGKIIYTYDGGESWIYENDLHEYINDNDPPTMIVRYAGTVPLISTYTGHFFRLLEDNLSPKPEDIYTISGRVWEGTKGQPGIPVSLGYRITMTNSEGYYKFTQVKKGSYTIKALNKYYDGVNQTYFYKPFDYKPMQYDIELTSDTSGFDFNAEDLRTFYSASGYIKDDKGKGLANITLNIKDSTAVSDSSGIFLFRKIESKRQYDLTPFSEDYTFSPAFHTINLITGDTTGLVFTATPTTSVWENIENLDILITPNPADDFITIHTSESLQPSEGYKVQIFDLLGIEIISESIHPMTTSHRMNIENLPAGVYFIRIGGKVEKFVKI
ncbi:MAG: T9SS type A sorting domain-containing protein [Candidatus Kapabacteria bacterium]|nr:T9SS type A sorting domain-containing protein [Candidatus Kapabacteria bacterium]